LARRRKVDAYRPLNAFITEYDDIVAAYTPVVNDPQPP